jgi:hypothetical protein
MKLRLSRTFTPDSLFATLKTEAPKNYQSRFHWEDENSGELQKIAKMSILFSIDSEGNKKITIKRNLPKIIDWLSNLWQALLNRLNIKSKYTSVKIVVVVLLLSSAFIVKPIVLT